jgi:hypothetical protein
MTIFTFVLDLLRPEGPTSITARTTSRRPRGTALDDLCTATVVLFIEGIPSLLALTI